jgi:hypothetical protein
MRTNYPAWIIEAAEKIIRQHTQLSDYSITNKTRLYFSILDSISKTIYQSFTKSREVNKDEI